MLDVSSQFGPNITNKRIRFAITFSQKNFKLVLGYKGKLVALHVGFVLLPLIKDAIFQKSGSKRDAFVT